MSTRIPWDMDEAVIMLDALLASRENRISRKEAIQSVSSKLRKRAEKQGIEVDDVFRNTNGITLQMKAMEYVLTDGAEGLDKPTKLFQNAVELYKCDRFAYEQRLKEATAVVDGKKTIEEQFMAWLATKVPPTQLTELYLCYSEIEKHCLKIKVLRKSLFETTDLATIKKVQKTISESKLFQLTHKRRMKKIVSAAQYYTAFIKEFESAQVEEIEEASTTIEQPNNMSIATVSTSVKEVQAVVSEPTVAAEDLVRDALKTECASNRYGTTVAYLYSAVRTIKVPEIKKILDEATWAKRENGRYHYIEPVAEAVSHEHKVEVKPDAQPAAMQVDFENITSLAYTRPTKVLYFGEKVNSTSSWTDAYVKLVAALYDDYPDLIPIGKSFTGAGRVDFGNREIAKTMTTPKRVFMEMYLETNFSATDIVGKIKVLLDICRVDYENVVIEYEGKDQKAPVAPIVSEAPLLENGNVPGESKPAFRRTRTTNTMPVPVGQKPQFDTAPYEKVLAERFVKGFRLGSTLDMKKFKGYYEELNGVAVDKDDATLEAILRDCGIVHEGKVFLPKTMLSEGIKNQLLAYIDEAFESGKTSVYYEALFNEFSEDFLDHYIYDADMLRSYLEYVNDGNYHVGKNQLSKEAGVTADPLEEVRACLKEHGGLMETDRLCGILAHLPRSTVASVLGSNLEFVRNSKGEYFHAEVLDLSEEELENIAELITTAIQTHRYISGTELMNAIRRKYPRTYEEFSLFSDLGWRDALKYKFGDRFSFKGNIISARGETLSMNDVFGELAASSEQLTMDELQRFAEEMGTAIYFDAVYENALRINENLFVPKTQANFRVKDTDAVLDRFCTGNYIPIGLIREFGIFPDAGFPWTSYLLECYTAYYSEKYTLLHGGYNRNCAVGAVAKKKANYGSFDDLVVDVLADSSIPLKKPNALDLLVRDGYIARRSYANIEELLIRANAQRNRKGRP